MRVWKRDGTVATEIRDARASLLAAKFTLNRETQAASAVTLQQLRTAHAYQPDKAPNTPMLSHVRLAFTHGDVSGL